MAENKTQPHGADPREFIAALTDARQRAEAEELLGIFADASGEPPTMWGPSIIGFGSTHYRYASGRQGDTATIGFSPRKGKFALYAAAPFRDEEHLLENLGRIDLAVGCLYIKSLDGIDRAVLHELLRRTYRSASTASLEHP